MAALIAYDFLTRTTIARTTTICIRPAGRAATLAPGLAFVMRAVPSAIERLPC